MKYSISIPTQIKDTCPICGNTFGLYYLPCGDEAQEKSKEFLPNQICENKIIGSKKGRSITQLNLYWACCGIMAELLSDHDNIWDKADIDFEIKIRIAKKKPALIKRFKVVSGMTYMEPISTSFANMKHLEACKYYDLALPEMAKMGRMTADELISLAKSKMRPRG